MQNSGHGVLVVSFPIKEYMHMFSHGVLGNSLMKAIKM